MAAHAAPPLVPVRLGRRRTPIRPGPAASAPVARIVLLSILGLAVALRLWGVRAGLPFMHHPDEPFNLRVADAMVRGGDPDPHFFSYPSLWVYLLTALHLDGPVLRWIPGLSGAAPVSQVIGVSHAPATGQVLLDRLLSVTADTVTVALTWATARRLTRGVLPATAAALLLTLSPTLIDNARLATPDALATTFVAATVWASVRALQHPTRSAFVLAGALTGLAAGTKYTAAVVAVAVLAAAIDQGRNAPRSVSAAGLTAAATFLVTTPYALLDRTQFLAGLEFEREHYRNGHPGMDGDTTGFYLALLRHREVVLVVAAAAGIVVTARRWRPLLVVCAFPVAHGLLITQQSVRNDRTVMLMFPALAVLAALAVEAVPAHRVRPPLVGVLAAVAVAVLIPTLPRPGPSPWEQAQTWLAAHAGDRPVVIEGYGPWLDPRPGVTYCTRLIDCERPSGAYLVLAEPMYGRFTPAQAPTRTQANAAYAQLLALPTEARFGGDGTELLIIRAP